MIRRFSLYGFLKNQRYHEPFFVLALREQGLSFLDIGLLIGVGSICVNLFEVPFGTASSLSATVTEFEATAVAAGIVYFVLGIVEATASARAGAYSRNAGGDAGAVRRLWLVHVFGSLTLIAALLAGATALAIAVFVTQFGVARSLFRAVQLARYDSQCPPELAATVLSLESQAQAVLIAIAAPLVGWMIDSAATGGDDARALWPAVAVGLVAVGTLHGADALRRIRARAAA